MSGPNALAIFAAMPRWVNWRNEPRADNPEKLTKVPYQPNGRKASSISPKTWCSRSIVESAVVSIVNGYGGGIGIVLGDLGEGYMLTGIDLDTCRRDDGSFEPWAEAILKRFATYTEISPSGNGAKLFFRVQCSDFEAIKPLLNQSKTGRQFKKSNGSDHPPGFEIYFTGRYFAVTDALLEGYPDSLAIIGYDDLRWLISEAGPALTAKDRNTRKGISDKSRSAAAFRIGLQMRRDGASFEDFCNAVRNDPETTAWYSEKGIAEGGRELHRIWEKAARNGAGWRAKLILNEANKPFGILANAITAFRHAPKWKDILAYDAFHLRTTIRGELPWPELPGNEWTSVHDIRGAEWLQREDIFVGHDIAAQAVEAVAREHQFHPVRAYLGSLKWDGTKRLDTWGIDYLGAVDTAYTRAVCAKWLISAIARIEDPGCKADCVPIFEGKQGLLKSTAIKPLAHPWFTDEIAELGTKDASVQLAGVWIIELAELDSMTRGEVSRTKAFASRTTDRFRPPYGKRTIDQPRQCVFAGTINQDQYLRDETGGRRWWPVACTKIDIPGLIAARDQLWAEARARYLAGEAWYLNTKELNDDAEEEQTSRYLHDAWEEPIADFIALRATVSIGQILKDALFITTDKWSQPDQNRVARILRLFKWQRKQERIVGTNKRQWVYRPPDGQPNQEAESGDF